ncbi:MAG: NUDIX domain-containing protein [Pseudomonadota bacterium]
MYPTDLTVAAIVRHEDNYLMVEERSMGRDVFCQPGGHIESGESPEQAVVREVLEETGSIVTCGDLVGVYLWIHPQTRQQFLRIVFEAHFQSMDNDATLDDGILRTLWMSRGEIENRRDRLRTPVALRCVADYEQGRRPADSVFTGMLPLQHNVDAVLARADLV